MEIKLLGAGAVQPGLAKVLEAFRKECGGEVEVSYATAPALRQRLGEGERADLIIAPPDVIDDLVKTGKIRQGDRAPLGRIGIGVAIRAGAPVPEIGTVEEFKRALLVAESIVYNQASTGLYLEKLFERLGIGEQIRSKTTRYPDFAAVRDHIANGKGSEIGLGATTVIVESANKGLQFAGPLPADLQNYTAYHAAVIPGSAIEDAATALLHYLQSSGSKALLKTAGIE
ncbi:MAG TPA: substrate-binding domain-containing protein [Methylomirabilota bacterium]|nr:substrate-binding domain-containing protein [Methylomirabilota bacterium]